MNTKKHVHRVLWEHGMNSLVLVLALFAIELFVFFTNQENERYFISWKQNAAEFGYYVFIPVLIIICGKIVIFSFLDYWCEDTVTKNICVYAMSAENEYHFALYTKNPYICLYASESWLMQSLMMHHILQPIILDKRITDVECQLSHSYHIKMLRFSHLVVDIKEIFDDRALQAQLSDILELIEQQQEKIELYQFEIHEQQKKYVKHHQKYANAADEQQKDVHRSMMKHIGAEIDRLNREKGEHEELLESYEQERKKLEEILNREKPDV